MNNGPRYVSPNKQYHDNWYKRRSSYKYKSPERSISSNQQIARNRPTTAFEVGILDDPGYSKITNKVNAKMMQDPSERAGSSKKY